MSEKKTCINNLLNKINKADDKIETIAERLKLIKTIINETSEQEVCQDVADSDKAIIEAIEKLFVEELLTREPEGDA